MVHKIHEKTENERLIQLGINPIFPGESETRFAYTKPKAKTTHVPLIINPQPTQRHFDRPFGTARLVPRVTEYQENFRMPDGRRINTAPWVQ